VIGRVGQGVFQLVDSMEAALSVLLHKWAQTQPAKIASLIGSVAKPIGIGFEALFNIYEGSTVLWTEATKQGTWESTIVRGRSAVLLVSGAMAGAAVAHGVALGSAAGAAGFFAAAAPAILVANVVLALAAITVVVLDITLYTIAGPANAMGEWEKSRDRAFREEFGDQPGQYRVSRAHDAGGRFLEELDAALATLASG
jgi:hypothetical protein